MRRALRVTFRATAWIPLAAILCLWWRSGAHLDFVRWQRWPVQWDVESGVGELWITRTLRTAGPPSWRDVEGWRWQSVRFYHPPGQRRPPWTEAADVRWDRAGVKYFAGDARSPVDRGGSSAPRPCRLVMLPFRWTALAAALLGGITWALCGPPKRRRSAPAASRAVAPPTPPDALQWGTLS
jgi:hypothetical protein